jgi:hypothetical protein
VNRTTADWLKTGVTVDARPWKKTSAQRSTVLSSAEKTCNERNVFGPCFSALFKIIQDISTDLDRNIMNE